MNVNELHLALDLGLQRLGSSVFDDILPEEKDIYLNDVIGKYVRVHRDLMISDNAQASTAATENIYSLLCKDEKVPTATGFSREFNVAKPDDLYLFATARVITTSIDLDKKLYDCQIVALRDYYRYAESAEGRPIFRIVPIVQFSDTFRFILPTNEPSNPSNFEFTYIKTPAIVSVEDGRTTDLPDFVHQDIVDMAVETMWEDIQRRDGQQPQQQARQ